MFSLRSYQHTAENRNLVFRHAGLKRLKAVFTEATWARRRASSGSQHILKPFTNGCRDGRIFFSIPLFLLEMTSLCCKMGVLKLEPSPSTTIIGFLLILAICAAIPADRTSPLSDYFSVFSDSHLNIVLTFFSGPQNTIVGTVAFPQ